MTADPEAQSLTDEQSDVMNTISEATAAAFLGHTAHAIDPAYGLHATLTGLATAIIAITPDDVPTDVREADFAKIARAAMTDALEYRGILQRHGMTVAEWAASVIHESGSGPETGDPGEPQEEDRPDGYLPTPISGVVGVRNDSPAARRVARTASRAMTVITKAARRKGRFDAAFLVNCLIMMTRAAMTSLRKADPEQYPEVLAAFRTVIDLSDEDTEAMVRAGGRRQ